MYSPNNLQLPPQQTTFHCHPNSRRSVPTVRPPRSVRKVHASMSPQSVLRVRPQVRPRQNTSSAPPNRTLRGLLPQQPSTAQNHSGPRVKIWTILKPWLNQFFEILRKRKIRAQQFLELKNINCKIKIRTDSKILSHFVSTNLQILTKKHVFKAYRLFSARNGRLMY